jgi:hypothetical protein
MQEQVNQSTSLQMSLSDEETPSTEPCIPEQTNQSKPLHISIPDEDLSEKNNELSNLQEIFPDRSNADLENALSSSINLAGAIDILLQNDDGVGNEGSTDKNGVKM